MMTMAPATTDAAFLMSEAPTDPLGLGILLLVGGVMSNDVFDQDGMVVDLDEYLETTEEYDWRDDHYECGCCSCCGCTCHDFWPEEDENEEVH